MSDSTAALPPDLSGAALLLSDNAAAAWLGISRATFWRRVKDQTFPKPIRIGGATRWRRDELWRRSTVLRVEQAKGGR
jgi:predicted DNA-binding transcriptional regulator AlpA